MKTEDIQARARRWLEDFDGIVGHPGITAVLIRDLLAEVERLQRERDDAVKAVDTVHAAWAIAASRPRKPAVLR